MEEMEGGRERGGCCPCALFAQATPALSSPGRAFLFHPDDAMQGIYGIDLSCIKSELRSVPETTQDKGLVQEWLVDGKTEGHKWSAGWSQAGGGENKKGVFCGGIGRNSPLLLDKNGFPCQAYVEQVAKLLLVRYLDAYTSMGASQFVVCTDNVSALSNLKVLAMIDRERVKLDGPRKMGTGWYELLGMFASELVKLLGPRNATMTVIHKNHPKAYQGGASARRWDPDRVANLGMTGCDMKQSEWAVGIDESAFKRLQFTEEEWCGSLLVSVKIQVAELLPVALSPPAKWFRIHRRYWWLWRNVATKEWFWEESPNPWRYGWKKYSCSEGPNGGMEFWWCWTDVDGSMGGYFFESTGSPERPAGLVQA